MNDFLKWFFAFITEILNGFGKIFLGLWNGVKQIFNIPEYIAIFKEYSKAFSVLEWILAILSVIVVIAVFAMLFFIIILMVRKYIRFRHSIVSNEDLLEEIADLQRKVFTMAREKDQIIAMKVAQMGGGAGMPLPAGAYGGLPGLGGAGSVGADRSGAGKGPDPGRGTGSGCDLPLSFRVVPTGGPFGDDSDRRGKNPAPDFRR